MYFVIFIILIAISLSIDTFSVAAVGGSIEKRCCIKNILKVGLVFASCQALLVFVGTLLGLGLQQFVSKLDHWFAFFLLSFIGFRLAFDSAQKKGNIDLFNNFTLFSLAVATSIDAFIVGITFTFLGSKSIWNIAIIAATTFIFAVTGFVGGTRFAALPTGKVRIFGGIVLFFIGLKILLEHLL